MATTRRPRGVVLLGMVSSLGLAVSVDGYGQFVQQEPLQELEPTTDATYSIGHGFAVDINDGTISVAAPGDQLDDNGYIRMYGVVRIYDHANGEAGVWTESYRIDFPLEDVCQAYDHYPERCPAFGTSLKLTDGLLAVGAPGFNTDPDDFLIVNQGGVFIFDPASDYEWKVHLISNEPVLNGYFGTSVAVGDQNEIYVGAPERAVGADPDSKDGRVERFDANGAWSWSFGEAYDGASESEFGHALAWESTTQSILIGAPGADEVHAIKAPNASSAGGRPAAQILRPRSGDGSGDREFGTSIATDGGLVVIGAPGYVDSVSGAVYFFQSDGFSWEQVGVLEAPNDDFIGFGSSVALEGRNLVVGTDGYEVGEARYATFVYDLEDVQNPTPVVRLKGRSFDAPRSVAIEGDYVVSSDWFDDDWDYLGETYVSHRYDELSHCPEDLNGNGIVGASDLLFILGDWGDCRTSSGKTCLGDLDGDGIVGATDLLRLLSEWGPCDG